MTMLQIDLPEKADVIVNVFKAKNRLKTKEEAVIKIIEMSGEEQ